MKRKFAINLILLLALNLLIKPFWIFGIDRTVQNMVGAGEYGLFYSLFNFSLLLNIILDFGITNFNNREISRHSQLLSKYLSNIVFVKILLAIFYSILCIVAALLMGYNGRQLYLLAFLVFNQFLSSFILYLRSNLSGLQYFKTDSVISVLDRFLMVLFCSLLLWGNFIHKSFSIEWFIYAQTFSYIITCIFTFLIVISKSEFFKIRMDRAFIVSILKQSYPYALLTLLMTTYSRIDSVMLERLLAQGNVESGIYAQAFRIVDAANMFPFLFAGLLMPMFSKMIKNQEPIQPLVGFAFSLLFVPCFTFSIVSIAYRSDIMQLLYHQHTTESSVLLGLLMGSFLLISINYIFGTLLTAYGSIKQLNYISVVGVIISVTLNFMLIPSLKSTGAAIANLSCQIIVVLLQVFLAFKTFKFRVHHRKYLPYIIFIILVPIIILLAKLIIPKWIIGFLSVLVASMILSIFLRIIKLKDFIQLFDKGVA